MFYNVIYLYIREIGMATAAVVCERRGFQQASLQPITRCTADAATRDIESHYQHQ